MKQNKFHIGDYVEEVGRGFFRVIQHNIMIGDEDWFMIEDGCDNQDVVLRPIPITPDTLEMFGFSEGVMNNLAQPCWVMWWNEGNSQTSIEVWPEKFQDTKSTDWMCRINRELNHCLVQVRAIHEIQHCMEVAGIKTELKYKL